MSASDTDPRAMPIAGRWGLSLLALAAGGAVTVFCAVVVARTAGLPAGDGTGMQWVVLMPLALLFLLAAVPAFIVGMTGLRAARSREAVLAMRRTRRRTFRALFWSIAAALVLLQAAPFVVLLIVGW